MCSNKNRIPLWENIERTEEKMIIQGKDNYFGELLRELRTARKMTLQDFEEKTGITMSYIQRLETGKSQPSLRVLEELADFLNVDPSIWFKNRIEEAIHYE